MIIFFSFYFLFFYFFSFIYLLFIIFFLLFSFFSFQTLFPPLCNKRSFRVKFSIEPLLRLGTRIYVYVNYVRLPLFEWIHSSHKCARTYTGVRMREGNNRMKLIIDRQGWKRGGKKKRRKKNTFWSVLDKMEFAFHAWWFSSTFLRFIFF